MLTDMMKDELVKGLLNLFHENLSMIILYGSVARNEATMPNFIFIFTCPKTLYLCGFSPFSIFLLHPFYTLFSTVGVAASNC